MKIDIKIDPNLKEPYAVFYTSEITPELQELVKALSTSHNKFFTGTKDQKIYIINPEEIYYFYCENQKVYAKTDKDSYSIKLRLYEVEEQLNNTSFVKISNSVIANIDKVSNLEMSFNGTMCVKFKNNATEYASRRYVSKLKSYLGL